MTHTKRKPLVPITREFLRQFYAKFPLEPVPTDAHNAHMRSVDDLTKSVTKEGSKVPEQIGMPTPTRIDDCFWRNRMICEEIALSLSKLSAALPDCTDLVASSERCRELCLSAERSIFAVQELNTSSVKAQLQQFIPQDFRGSLLESKRVASEARYKKQIDDLVKKGGTIRQKYDLYLQQQWERRQALVQLGECSGMFKMMIKLLAGIPQVLLDFAKEINAKLGPMEEQRIKYGPDLYGITTLGFRLDVCLAGWVESAGSAAGRAAATQMASVVEPAVQFYCEHMLRVIRFIGDVFQHSPFFVNKEDLEAHGAPAGSGGSDVAAGKAVTAALVAAAGSTPAAATAERSVEVAAANGNKGGGGAGGGDGDKAALSAVAGGGGVLPPTMTAVVSVSTGPAAVEGKKPGPLATGPNAEAAATPGAAEGGSLPGSASIEPSQSLPSPPSTPVAAAGLPVCPSTGRANDLSCSAEPRDAFASVKALGPSPLGPGAAAANTSAGSAAAPVVSVNVTATSAASAAPAAPAPVGPAHPSPSVGAAAAAASAAVATVSQTGNIPLPPAASPDPAPAASAAAVARVAPLAPAPFAAAGAAATEALAAAPAAAATTDVKPPVASVAAPAPSRPPPLVHVPTPSPHLLSHSSLGSRAVAARESVASFASAEEDQPWHRPEEGYVAVTAGGGMGTLLKCLGLGAHGTSRP